MRQFEIACLQLRPRPDPVSALEEAMPLAKAAVEAGAQFLFLPEYCGGLARRGDRLALSAAPENEHPVLAEFRAFAACSGVWVMIGSLAVDAGAGKIVNRGYVLDDGGEIRSRYDKIHMCDIQLPGSAACCESSQISPGEQAVIVDTPFGKIGHTICYDLRFPYLFRDLAKSGAEIICVPSAFMKKSGEAHWHILNRARAIENGVFIVSACATGLVSGGGASYGHSLVVAPWGEILADGGEDPGLVMARIDLELVAEARASIPSLDHDRVYTVSTSSGQ